MPQKKVRDQPAVMRLSWISGGGELTQKRLCTLAGVVRATVYANLKAALVMEIDVLLRRLIDEEYTLHPFYGRKMVMNLGRCGHRVNRKRAQRLMRLAALMNWYSRRVLSWRISNSMEAAFCVDCLEDALRVHGKPEVFKSDQGVQFTSEVFTGVLKREEITISVGGRDGAYDNIFVERLLRSVKHEDIYLNGYATMGELLLGLSKYFVEYNGDRPHQPLGNKTSHEVYVCASGGGAMIVDKYNAKEGLPVALRSSGTAFRKDIRNRIQKPGQRRAAA